MRDTGKPFRKAIYAALNGLVLYKGLPVPIYDEKVFTGQLPNIYIIMGKQTETDVTDNDCTWSTRATLELWIISKTGSEVSKDVVDDVSQAILDLLIGLPTTDMIAPQAGLQIMTLTRESSVSGQVLISQTQSELQKVLTLAATIVQLN